MDNLSISSSPSTPLSGYDTSPENPSRSTISSSDYLDPLYKPTLDETDRLFLDSFPNPTKYLVENVENNNLYDENSVLDKKNVNSKKRKLTVKTNQQLSPLEQRLQLLNSRIVGQNNFLKKRRYQLERQEEQLEEQKKQLEEQKKQLASQEIHIKNLTTSLRSQTEIIDQLNNKLLLQMEREKNLNIECHDLFLQSQYLRQKIQKILI